MKWRQPFPSLLDSFQGPFKHLTRLRPVAQPQILGFGCSNWMYDRNEVDELGGEMSSGIGGARTSTIDPNYVPDFQQPDVRILVVGDGGWQ